MFTILRTELFDNWIRRLTDTRGKAHILERINMAECGNLGDCRPVGNGVLELRIHYGPGYRLYLTRSGEVVYILLCGGTKQGQQKDIRRAKKLAREIKEK